MRRKKPKKEYFQVRLTEDERKMLDEQCAKVGLTPSAYLRMLLYEREKK